MSDDCCPACGRDWPTTNKAGPNTAGSATSRAAAFHVAPRTGTQRADVLAAVLHAYDAWGTGYTDEEGIDTTGLNPSTYRPRRVELVQGGWVEDAGIERPVRSGEKAVVWAPTRAAIEWAQREGVGHPAGALTAVQGAMRLF